MQFYVYTLAYPDGKVFYVGKGQGNRINQHEHEARTGKDITNKHKVGVIRKIWAGGGEVVKEKIYETYDEQEALEVEQALIASIGRSNLTNLTDGGEGTSGHRGWRTKTWAGFIDPFGEEFRNIENLWDFCEEHGLGYNLMLLVDKGEKDNYKGWRKIGRMAWCETEFPYNGPYDCFYMVRKTPTIYDRERYINVPDGRGYIRLDEYD